MASNSDAGAPADLLAEALGEYADVIGKLSAGELAMKLKLAEFDELTEADLNAGYALRFEHDLALADRRAAEARRERDQARAEAESQRATVSQLRIEGALRDAAAAERVRPEALPDLLLHASAFEVTEDGRVATREGADFAQGLDPVLWMHDRRSDRPHWWPASVSAGARGGLASRSRSPRHRDDFASVAEKAAWCGENGHEAFAALPMAPNARAQSNDGRIPDERAS